MDLWRWASFIQRRGGWVVPPVVFEETTVCKNWKALASVLTKYRAYCAIPYSLCKCKQVSFLQDFMLIPTRFYPCLCIACSLSFSNWDKQNPFHPTPLSNRSCWSTHDGAWGHPPLDNWAIPHSPRGARRGPGTLQDNRRQPAVRCSWHHQRTEQFLSKVLYSWFFSGSGGQSF